MVQMPMTLNEFEGYFCCYKWQNALSGPSASAELLVSLLVHVILTVALKKMLLFVKILLINMWNIAELKKNILMQCGIVEVWLLWQRLTSNGT